MTSSTKIAIAAVAAALALTACSHRTDGGWRKDCESHYSYDSRENAVCKEHLSTGTATERAVMSDTQDASRPVQGSRQTEKGHGN